MRANHSDVYNYWLQFLYCSLWERAFTVQTTVITIMKREGVLINPSAIFHSPTWIGWHNSIIFYRHISVNLQRRPSGLATLRRMAYVGTESICWSNMRYKLIILLSKIIPKSLGFLKIDIWSNISITVYKNQKELSWLIIVMIL